MSKKQKIQAAAGEKITISFGGKDIEVTIVQPGVVQKSESIYYIQDSKSGEWLYCSPDRLNKVLKKWNGDLSKYQGRASKAISRQEQAASKTTEAPKEPVPQTE